MPCIHMYCHTYIHIYNKGYSIFTSMVYMYTIIHTYQHTYMHTYIQDILSLLPWFTSLLLQLAGLNVAAQAILALRVFRKY